ncbi:MAG TPA: response regulator [Longimicrobium sp.]
MKVRTLIVDDEDLARQRITELLADEPDFAVVGECGDGEEAAREIRRLRPDLVFLDVQMPEMDGFEVLSTIDPARAPVVVFVTAYDEFALRAFEAHAIDYLLKPFYRPRFHVALDRARAQLAQRNAAPPADARLRRLLESLATAERPALERFVIRTGTRIYFVPVGEVDWIQAEGNYVRLHTGARTHLLRASITSIADRLDPRVFLRIHRSTILNLGRLREVHPFAKGTFVVVLQDGTRLTSSITYRAGIETLIAG